MNKYISNKIFGYMSKSSMIRKMFEKGNELKKLYGEENVYDFSIGNPDVIPPENFFNSLKKISLEHEAKNHSYMPNAGYTGLRKKLSAYLSIEYKTSLGENNIVMTTGAAGALNIALKSILNPEDEVIIISPYFVEYVFYIENFLGKPVVVESKSNFDIDVDAIEKALTEKTKAIIINSPNNPTGKVYSKENLEQLSKVLEKSEQKYDKPIFVLSDEPYRNIVFDNIEVPSVFEVFKNCIVVNSYSKELSLPGERIGYVLINPNCKAAGDLFDALVLCNRISGFVNAPALIQRILENCYEEKVAVDIYEKRRNIFYNALVEMGYRVYKPEGTFYFFVEIPDRTLSDTEFTELLQKENILVVPGIGFGRKGYFRIAYCVQEITIKNSLIKFKKVIDSLKNAK